MAIESSLLESVGLFQTHVLVRSSFLASDNLARLCVTLDESLSPRIIMLSSITDRATPPWTVSVFSDMLKRFVHSITRRVRNNLFGLAGSVMGSSYPPRYVFELPSSLGVLFCHCIYT